jgi:serine/threonine protein kinase
VLARLEHPAIVPVHDLGVLPDGRPYYVMKLVRGRDLATAVVAEPSLHGRLRLFERICEAVAFAHARGVIHRDLKPSNVMVGAFGEVLVLDWGLAKLRTTRDEPVAPSGLSASGSANIGEPNGREPRTAAGTVLGTPGYMAPEQLAGEPVDERTDVYALGVLLDWLLAVPFGASAAEGSTPVGRSGREPPVPRPLAAVADRARAVSPGDRYPDVSALVADIRRYLDGLAVTAHQEGALDRVARFARRHRVAIALVAAYLLMRVALLLWAQV